MGGNIDQLRTARTHARLPREAVKQVVEFHEASGADPRSMELMKLSLETTNVGTRIVSHVHRSWIARARVATPR